MPDRSAPLRRPSLAALLAGLALLTSLTALVWGGPSAIGARDTVVDRAGTIAQAAPSRPPRGLSAAQPAGFIDLTGSAARIVTLRAPAGRWMVSAIGIAYMSSDQTVPCEIRGGGRVRRTISVYTGSSPSAATFAMSARVPLRTRGRITLWCQGTSSRVLQSHLTAVAVR